MQSEKWVLSTTEIAEIYRVEPRTMLNWEKKGCPKYARGRWNLPDVIKWREEGISPIGDITGEDLKARKLMADTEYREERAIRERILRETLEDQYFRKTDVEDAWVERVLEAKAGFLLFSKTLPMELVGKNEKEIEAVIDARVREVLIDYARAGDYTSVPSEEANNTKNDKGRKKRMAASGETNSK